MPSLDTHVTHKEWLRVDLLVETDDFEKAKAPRAQRVRCERGFSSIPARPHGVVVVGGHICLAISVVIVPIVARQRWCNGRQCREREKSGSENLIISIQYGAHGRSFYRLESFYHPDP